MNKDELLYQFGIVHCTADEYGNIPDTYIQGVRKNQFGCEVLVNNLQDFQKRYPGYHTERTSIENIILFYVKGEKR